MPKNESHVRTIHKLLGNARYQLDYYQREYSWQTKHVTELLDDLNKVFSDSYTEGDTLENVPKYDHYFLGSIIISRVTGQQYIVDGQQRITTPDPPTNSPLPITRGRTLKRSSKPMYLLTKWRNRRIQPGGPRMEISSNGTLRRYRL